MHTLSFGIRSVNISVNSINFREKTVANTTHVEMEGVVLLIVTVYLVTRVSVSTVFMEIDVKQ